MSERGNNNYYSPNQGNQPKSVKPPIANNSEGRGHPAFTVLLSFLLFLLILATVLVGVVRQTLSEQAIAEAVSRFDVDVIVEELEVYDRITDIVDEQILDIIGISEETVAGFFDQEVVRNFVAENASELLDGFIHGHSSITITQDEIFRLVRESLPFVKEEFGFELNTQLIDYVERHVRESDQIPDSIIIDVDESNVGIDLEPFRQLLMPRTFTILAAALIAAVILIFVINLFRIRLALLGTGVASTVAGGLILILGFFFLNVLTAFTQGDFTRELIANVLLGARDPLMTAGRRFLIAGLLMWVAHETIKKFSAEREIQEKPNSQQ